MSNDIALRVDRLYRFYRAGDEETLALQGVSFTVRRGELVAVAGPSGSGKSTLLACLAGLDEPSGGTVWVGGQRMSHQPEPARSRLRAHSIGSVSQSGNLFDHLTVAQNVRLARSLAGGTATDGLGVLDAVGLRERAAAYPMHLSGGESARAALGVALANDPVIVLADEPTGELDEVTEERILGLLLERARKGGAVVLASHSPEASRIADRALRLDDGRLAA